MKEITSSQGGRFRYNEDIKALQESALAINEFLKQLDGNFVLSGCKNNDDGYVWLDGKIRYVEATLPSVNYSYIIAEDTDGIDIEYADKTNHQMNIVYSAKYSTTASSSARTIAKLPELKDFPRLGYALFHQFSIDKETTLKSVIDAPMDFSDNLGASQFNINVGTAKIQLMVEYPYFLIKFIFGSKEYALKLPFSKHTVHFRGDDKEWSISDIYEGNNDSGELFYDSATINNLDIRDSATCEDLQIKTSNGEYLSISDVINNTTAIVKGLYYPINAYTKESVSEISIRKSNDIISVQGLLPIEYIIGNAYSSCHTGDPFYLSNLKVENQQYHLKCDTVSNTSGITYLRIKTALRLPNGFPLPDANRMPGTILCSDMVNYSSSRKFNGNMQLMIGADGYFYIIVTSEANRDYVNFVLNGNYINENSNQTRMGAAFNLTYVI